MASEKAVLIIQARVNRAEILGQDALNPLPAPGFSLPIVRFMALPAWRLLSKSKNLFPKIDKGSFLTTRE